MLMMTQGTFTAFLTYFLVSCESIEYKSTDDRQFLWHFMRVRQVREMIYNHTSLSSDLNE